MARSSWLMFTVAMSACGPTPGLTPDVTDTSAVSMSTDTTEPAGSSAPTGGTTHTSSATGEALTGDATTPTGPETTSGDSCEDPDPDSVGAEWSIRFPDGVPATNISAQCSVSALGQRDRAAAVFFACKLDVELELVLSTVRIPVQPLPFEIGDEVQLEYRLEQLSWLNQWFSIRYAANPTVMALGGISADRVTPPGASVQDFYFATLEVISGLCTPGNDGVPCALSERLALDVDFVGSQERIFDGQFATRTGLAGEYAIWLATAARQSDPATCNTVEPAWVQALMALSVGS